MDENGDFWLGTCLMWEMEAIKTCTKIILQINSNLPYTNGSLKINIKDVTALTEATRPLTTIPDAPSSPTEEQVGENVASLVRDGDCIQLGIGSLPNAIGRHLMDKKDLGLHTEMFTSLMGEMIRKGVITGARKNINRGVHIGCFAGGDEALYQTLNDNSACKIMPATYAVNPIIIMQNDNQVSINTCLEMDLTGQVCSETIGTTQYSGTGGAFDFAWGAMHSKGGRGILAFPSTAKNGTISKIKAILTPGSAVTIPRCYVDYVVTEYGIAHLRGRDVRERANALISISHPDFREDLRREARKLMYI
jgi:acyl-CoA hydrolase